MEFVTDQEVHEIVPSPQAKGENLSLFSDMIEGHSSTPITRAKKLTRRASGRGEAPSAEQQILSDLYHEFESNLCVHDVPEDGTLKFLVTFDDCKVQPVHRWYTFKEGYSHKLLSNLQEWGVFERNKDLRLLDPFCGVGTTLVAASHPEQNANFSQVVGVEVNPTIKFIAETKLNWHSYDPDMVMHLAEQLQHGETRGNKTFKVPELSTFSAMRGDDKTAFDPTVVQDLLFYREWISHLSGSEKEFLLLAWLSIIESVSYACKDGRALRLLKAKERPSTPPDVRQALLSQIHMMHSDLLSLRKQAAKTIGNASVKHSVILGDARKIPLEECSFDVICYSPPYLNNIDYTEVYKMELWMKGDVATQEEFRSQRLKTMRSHPSIIFPATDVHTKIDSSQWLPRLRKTLMEAIPDDEHLVSRQRLFSGYIDDLLSSLSEQKRVAVPGAPIICVVGNSLFGGEKARKVVVCTDLLVAAAAQAVGLQVEQIRIARHLPRRDNQNGWLRESIIVMRKPEGNYG